MASQKIAASEDKLIKLEKSINPLLDDDDMVGLSFILNEIVQECKNLPKSVAFHTKVDPKKVYLDGEVITKIYTKHSVPHLLHEDRAADGPRHY